MILVAKKNRGIIKKGMKFVYLSETDSDYECWSVELNLHFRISKKIVSDFFEKREF